MVDELLDYARDLAQRADQGEVLEPVIARLTPDQKIDVLVLSIRCMDDARLRAWLTRAFGSCDEKWVRCIQAIDNAILRDWLCDAFGCGREAGRGN